MRNECQYCFGRSGVRDKAPAFIPIASADGRIGRVTTRDVAMAAFGGTIFAGASLLSATKQMQDLDPQGRNVEYDQRP